MEKEDIKILVADDMQMMRAIPLSSQTRAR
jgi:hypothetical protein